MPKSKRDRVVTLSRVQRKRPDKLKLTESIVDACVEYKNVYVITIENSRNALLEQMRKHWTPSRLVIGRNKVVALGLRDAAQQLDKPILAELADLVRGQCALWFVNENTKSMKKYCDSLGEPEFARAGSIAESEYVIASGALPTIQFSQAEHLRSLSLPVRLDKGTVLLDGDSIICKPGEKLTANQCAILKLFGAKIATQRVRLHSALDLQAKNPKFVEIEARAPL